MEGDCYLGIVARVRSIEESFCEDVRVSSYVTIELPLTASK